MKRFLPHSLKIELKINMRVTAIINSSINNIPVYLLKWLHSSKILAHKLQVSQKDKQKVNAIQITSSWPSWSSVPTHYTNQNLLF